MQMKLGDARLKMREAPDHHYKVILVDAFTSDAIPIHLITLEALQLYRRKLAPDGIVAFHISNRYLDLEPVLANLAKHEGMVALIEHSREDEDIERTGSTWVMGDPGPAAAGGGLG
jgi:spermidine synthase